MDKTRLIVGAGAIAGFSLLCVFGLLDPTHTDQARLDLLSASAKSAHGLDASTNRVSYNSEMDTLIQSPIFVMTTGASAYSEKTLQIFGVSISNTRKAALVSIAGATPVWMRAGELVGDIQLTDVDAISAHFDTPLGARDINLNDPPSGAPVNTPPKAIGG